MKERLIELLHDVVSSAETISLENIADHLLENGVIVKSVGKMTVDEKRDALSEFCGSVVGCDGCPLNTRLYKWKKPYGGTLKCLDFSESPESDLDRAMEICGIANTVQGE